MVGILGARLVCIKLHFCLLTCRLRSPPIALATHAKQTAFAGFEKMALTMRSRRRCLAAMAALGLCKSGVDSFVGPALAGRCVRGSQSFPSSSRVQSGSLEQPRRASWAPRMTATAVEIEPFPYQDVLPFLAEHVQPSDQMLVLGCGTELPLQLSRDGYGTRDSRSFIRCIDSDPDVIAAIKAAAEADPVCAKNMANGRLIFEALDVAGDMPELEQSSIDCVVDVGLLDKVLASGGLDAAKKCSDGAHRAVRLGNPLVAISKVNKDDFAAIFDGNWGWMQELDGDPGAVSQWYRNKKVNLKDVTNNFVQLGISFFVYTNVDNC